METWFHKTYKHKLRTVDISWKAYVQLMRGRISYLVTGCIIMLQFALVAKLHAPKPLERISHLTLSTCRIMECTVSWLDIIIADDRAWADKCWIVSIVEGTRVVTVRVYVSD